MQENAERPKLPLAAGTALGALHRFEKVAWLSLGSLVVSLVALRQLKELYFQPTTFWTSCFTTFLNFSFLC